MRATGKAICVALLSLLIWGCSGSGATGSGDAGEESGGRARSAGDGGAGGAFVARDGAAPYAGDSTPVRLAGPARPSNARRDGGAVAEVCGPSGLPCDPLADSRVCSVCDGTGAAETCRCVGVGGSAAWQCVGAAGACSID